RAASGLSPVSAPTAQAADAGLAGRAGTRHPCGPVRSAVRDPHQRLAVRFLQQPAPAVLVVVAEVAQPHRRRQPRAGGCFPALAREPVLCAGGGHRLACWRRPEAPFPRSRRHPAAHAAWGRTQTESVRYPTVTRIFLCTILALALS